MAPFPFPHLNEIREKYMFSITPFSPLGSLEKSEKEIEPSMVKKDKGRQSDDEVDFDEDDLQAMTCFTGFFPMPISPQRARIEMGETFVHFQGRMRVVLCFCAYLNPSVTLSLTPKWKD